jgi:hypothetical protein
MSYVLTFIAYSGYNIHLLPILPSVYANTDLAVSPVFASDLPSIGSDCSEYGPDAAYWQRFHDSFGMILYTILSNAVKSSAIQVHDQIVKNALHMDLLNGFKVMHKILQQHHPKVANFLTPAYNIITCAPKMETRKSSNT